MSNLPLQPLVWFERKDSNMYGNIKHCAQGAGIFYTIMPTSKDVEVCWGDSIDGSYGHRTLRDVADAKEWVKTDHYPSKMQPYVKPDSITDIRNWFKAAKPEPTDEDLSVQIGCCLEEVCELLEGLGAQTGHYRELADLANEFKYKGEWALKRVRNLTYQQRIDIVDACCDINVTSVGVMQLLGGVNVLGAQREVIRSNNSKMVDGKFEFDDNGKIMKAESYSKPVLTPFVK